MQPTYLRLAYHSIHSMTAVTVSQSVTTTNSGRDSHRGNCELNNDLLTPARPVKSSPNLVEPLSSSLATLALAGLLREPRTSN